MTKDDAVPVTAELLPCPFCGGPAKADNEESEDVGGYFVSCTKCPVSAWGDGRPEAITAWNARHRGSTAGVDVGDAPKARAIYRRWADENAARDRLATFPETVRQRLTNWQEGQSEWFSDTVLEIVAEFIAFDDAALASLSQTPATPMVQEGLRETLAYVGHLATCKDGHAHYCPNCDRSLGEICDVVDDAISASPAPPVDETDRLRGQVIADIDGERRRQVEAEGWTNDHDDEHADCQMAGAAACYAISAIPHWAKHEAIRLLWPWAKGWWKPRSHRENLVRAGALIVAEIERIDRAALADRTQEGEVRRG